MNRNNNNNNSSTLRAARQQQQPAIAQATTKRPANNSHQQPTMTLATPSSNQSSAIAANQPQVKPTTTATIGRGGDCDKGRDGDRGKLKGPGADTRKVGAAGRLAAPTTTKAPAPAGQPAGLMKKAHVRFDDYLDLNEENMRRSCKRLMNHLYSESSLSPASPPSPSSSSPPPLAADAVAIVCNNSGGATAIASTIRKSRVPNEVPKRPPATGALLITKPSMANNSNSNKFKSHSSGGATTDISISCKTVAATAPASAHVQQSGKQNSTTIGTSVPTIGKSYLRSQYERRQQRQLELMSKMQLEPGKRSQQQQQAGNNNSDSNSNADGANECRQQHQEKQQQKQNEHQKQKHQQQQQQLQQQDLVAKSHELSKRRFFEKLERRESIRNLNLSTPPPPPPSISDLSASRLKVAPVAAAAPDAKNCPQPKTLPTKTMDQDDNKTELQPARQPPPLADNRQNGLGDDELMLMVYQSIVLKGTNLPTAAETATTLSNCDGFNNDTLGGLDGTLKVETSLVENTNELANELFGFCTQSRPISVEGRRQLQPLIEFSTTTTTGEEQQLKQQQQDAEQQLIQLDENNSSSCFFKTHSETAGALANHSAFEIRVPETLDSCQNSTDGFISSGLLIVRQVEELATVDSHLLPPVHQEKRQQRQLPAYSASSGSRLVRGPPTLSGRRAHKEANAPAPPSTQPAANKTKTPPPLPLLNIDELADNKMQQIDGTSSKVDRAMEKEDRSIIVGGATSLGSSSKSNSPSAATMAAQTHQEQAGLRSGSITISSENNNNNSNHHNSNSNNNELMNKAIRPIEVRLKTTTTSNGIDHGGKLERETGEEFRAALSGEHSNQQRKVEVEETEAKVGGAGGMVGKSNCVKDHEAPETRMLAIVGQSGGAAKSSTNGHLVAVEPDEDGRKERNSAAYLQLNQTTQSTAQAQQVASLQTTITTKQPEIRDVLPMANEINRIEAIVRGSSCGSRPKLEALAAADADDPVAEKVTLVKSAKQVNEVYGSMVQHERSDQKIASYGGSRDGYANAVAASGEENGMRENNVNHDVCGLRLSTILSSSDSCSSIVGDAMGGEHGHLIEPFTGTKHHSSLTQKHSNSLSVEEDGGSSCGSSGFGASVSVTSSSEGSNSLSDTMLVVAAGADKRDSGLIRRPNSLATVQIPSSRNGDQIYDSVRPRAWAGRYQQKQQQQQQQYIQNIVPGSENAASNKANEFPDYKQLVGPDQAYPLKSGRLLLVENHNYASILDRCDVKNGMGGKNEGILFDDRDDSVEGYANLPLSVGNNISNNANNKVPPNVEYATVRPPTISNNSNNGNNIMDISQGKTKRLDDSASDAATDLSGRSYSTTSLANSGGFSALPPVRLECPSSNNLDSQFDHLNTTDNASSKKSSILKRFGFLVSRAFTASQQQQTNVQSQDELTKKTISTSIPKINESSLVNSQAAAGAAAAAKASQVGAGAGDCDGIARKSALVIEQNYHCQPKNQLPLAAHKEQDIGEADLVILPPKHVNQQQHKQHQNIENNSPIQRHDDRLSRGNRRSCKLKKINSASAASLSTPASSSESPSPSSLSASSTNIRIPPNEQHPKRSESLFEDLESLVSISEPTNAYGKIGSLRRSRRRATSTSRRKQSRATIEGRIEIDCISPGRLRSERDKGDNTAAAAATTTASSSKAGGGPRSLLRIFNAISSSQRSSESTPNLAAPIQSCCSDYASNCEPIFGEQEEEIDQSSLQPISGFWGFSSLMTGTSHARADVAASGAATRVSSSKQARSKNSPKMTKGERQNGISEYQANSSMFYSNLQPQADGYSLHIASGRQEDHNSLDKYQSLNLYQNLLRNYAKRRNRNRHGHHHHHSHHHHHHRHSTRHSYRSMRCSAQNCQLSSSGSEISGANQGRAVVWGQLIKINKTDGSQVIELQRLPGKSWGFFVARGAINDIKGIFISRMHDSVTSNSLSGLLSIGDRILAIDECPIGPDYDILRVNQMMSQKSKILLKVKPFKG